MSNIDQSQNVQDPSTLSEPVDKEVFQRNFGRRQQILDEISGEETENLLNLWNNMDPILEKLPDTNNSQNKIVKNLLSIIDSYFNDKDHTDITQKYREQNLEVHPPQGMS